MSDGDGWRAWDEVGAGVFRRRYRESFDVNCGLVLGDDEALLVDTRCHEDEGSQLREEVGRLTSLPVRVVVNTHAHFDHCFGNAVFVGADLWGQVGCARHLAEAGERERATALELVRRADRPRVQAARIVPPDHLVAHGFLVPSEVAGAPHTDRGLGQALA